jgi:hypothetical protein
MGICSVSGISDIRLRCYNLLISLLSSLNIYCIKLKIGSFDVVYMTDYGICRTGYAHRAEVYVTVASVGREQEKCVLVYWFI